jgi:restriction system protein
MEATHMSTLSAAPLRERKSELEQELARVDKQIALLSSQKDEIERDLAALAQLLRESGKSSSSLRAGLLTLTISERRASGRSFTPVEAYWVPILESLVEMNGSAPSDHVIDRVGTKMDAILTARDREMLSSGIDIRWRNRAAWQRENMKRQGLLRNDSPRGIWEITEAGRKWLESRRRG